MDKHDVMTGPNTREELALVEVVKRGGQSDGEACSPFGWFGIAQVEPGDEAWLSDEHDLPMPEVGWWMVVQNCEGVITAMRVWPQVAERWFYDQSQLYQDWVMDLCED